MNKLTKLEHTGMEAYLFECPGCGMDHLVPVAYTDEYRASCLANGANATQWGWNGSITAPTFSPSILVRGKNWPTEDEQARIMAGEHVEMKQFVCHSFVNDGRIQFLDDSTHHLKGQTVELLDADS